MTYLRVEDCFLRRQRELTETLAPMPAARHHKCKHASAARDALPILLLACSMVSIYSIAHGTITGKNGLWSVAGSIVDGIFAGYGNVSCKADPVRWAPLGVHWFWYNSPSVSLESRCTTITMGPVASEERIDGAKQLVLCQNYRTQGQQLNTLSHHLFEPLYPRSEQHGCVHLYGRHL